MSSRLRVFDSTVGSKILIGLTGLALFVYLITHIIGNVLVFLGADIFNQYAHTLTSNPLRTITKTVRTTESQLNTSLSCWLSARISQNFLSLATKSPFN